MHRGRCEGWQADLVSAQREDEAERDRGVLLDHLQVARASRPGERQGNEGQADRWNGPEGHAIRWQAHDLWGLQDNRRGLNLRSRPYKTRRARAQPLKGHPTADYIRDLATAEVQSVLTGANPAAPWIAIFDPVATQTATRGYYVVYLFHVSEPVLHLSLNQGTRREITDH